MRTPPLALILMVHNNAQFYEMSHEEPNIHISYFLEICDTIMMNGLTKMPSSEASSCFY